MTDDAATGPVLAGVHRLGPDLPPSVPPSAETLRLYALDWMAFETWCAAAGRTPFPATAATVAAFLTEAGAGPTGAPGRRLRRRPDRATEHARYRVACQALDADFGSPGSG
jgi:hypothetical protein